MMNKLQSIINDFIYTAINRLSTADPIMSSRFFFTISDIYPERQRITPNLLNEITEYLDFRNIKHSIIGQDINIYIDLSECALNVDQAKAFNIL